MNCSFRSFLFSALGLILLTGGMARAGSLDTPNIFVSGAVAKADEMNANFAAVKAAVDDNDARISTTVSFLNGNLSGGYSADLSTADHIQFDNVSAVNGTSIVLDTVSAYSTVNDTDSVGRITLSAGKTYKLWGTINNATVATYGATVWYNADTGARIGLVSGSAQPISTANRAPGYGTFTYFTPGVDTRVELRPAFQSLTNVRGTNDAIGPAQFVVEEVGSGADLAELYPTKDAGLRPGDLISMDPSKAVFVKRADAASGLIGVYSTAPGEVLGDSSFPDEHLVPIALTGRIPVNVVLENGPIDVGDYLTASSKPGYAMKATKSGRVIGMALESSGSEGSESSTKVLAFVNAHHWESPDTYQELRDVVELLRFQVETLTAQQKSGSSHDLTTAKGQIPASP